MNNAYAAMLRARMMLSTPDAPPAADRHHSWQPRHWRQDAACAFSCFSPCLSANTPASSFGRAPASAA